MDRTCDNCGEGVQGGPRRRYCSDECRFAARRAREAEKEAQEPAIPEAVEPGRCRAGLESWIEDNGIDLPSSLIEAARSLADQVDASPRHSPLWGRYQNALEALEHARRTRDAELANNPFLHDLQMEMASLSAIEEYRAKRCAEADTEAERRRWGRLVPIGCARGEHRAHRWPAGRVTCIDCETDLAEHVSVGES